MSELLLNTIIEKLNQLTALVGSDIRRVEDKDPANGVIMEELKALRQCIRTPSPEIRHLALKLDRLGVFPNKPAPQQVTHHHHITKSIGIGLSMLLLIVFLSVQLFSTHNKLKEYRGNDIKYRALKLKSEPVLRRWLFVVDSFYGIDAKNMTRKVIQSEDEFKKKAELLMIAAQKEKEARQLREKASEK